MLVAMSIAAVSLVRSVDTTVVVSGNLAFQQAALRRPPTTASRPR